MNDQASTSWPAISRQLKQAIKTGLAGLIAYAIYAHFQLREGYWAVFTALIVTQANLGASWQAALYRTIGTTAGAVSAALLAAFLGPGPIRTGILLFILAAVFAYLTARHPSFSAAGFTVALVLFFGHSHEYFQLAWYRVLYTIMGALIAFVVGVLVWPVRAREGLRAKIALLLDDCARLTLTVTEGALSGNVQESQLDELEHTITLHRRAITQGIEEARSEPARSRFDHDAYVSFVEGLDHIRVHLLGLSGDTATYAASAVAANLVPSLPALCQQISQGLAALGSKLLGNAGLQKTAPEKTKAPAPDALQSAMDQVDRELKALREARATSPFALDHMLPFWSFVFNLKETAAGVENLRQKLPQLA